MDRKIIRDEFHLSDRIEERFDRIDQKLGLAIDAVEALTQGLAGVRRNLADLHGQLAGVNRRLDHIERQLGLVETMPPLEP